MNTLSRVQAILLAIFVTIIWSFSWVLIKFGLQDNIPPLTFAGLRYTIASIILLTVVLKSPARRTQLRQLSRQNLLQLGFLGLLYYTATQGLLFLALSYLPAATYSLILNFTSIVVMIGGVIFLNEYPNPIQIGAMLIFLCGILLYFFPTSQPVFIGLVVGVLSMLANAGSSLLGRAINRQLTQTALTVTVVSMGIGASILLIIGLAVEGWQTISLTSWGIILWLAVVHTALAFTLWNKTLTVLSASESSLINSTMLIQTALLAWLFLGEALSIREIVALFIASVGIVIFQLRRTHIKPKRSN